MSTKIYDNALGSANALVMVRYQCAVKFIRATDLVNAKVIESDALTFADGKVTAIELAKLQGGEFVVTNNGDRAMFDRQSIAELGYAMLTTMAIKNGAESAKNKS